MIDLGEWSFIPGPPSFPLESSVVLQDLIEYPPQVIAAAILNFPGTRVTESGDGNWWQWWAEWREGPRHIGVGMTLFETDPVSWGGSQLKGVCELDDILGLWETVRITCPGVWMHNSDCEIHTPASFKRRFPT